MRMKVLIVDDEERQRSGLVRYADWDAAGMTVTGEAESARQALELAAANPPDLMITDIRLLGEDGLELSRSMRAIYKDLKIIIITGYEEFEYAKTAIDIGIEAFLVKPIDFPELNGILKKISHSFAEGLEKREEDLQLREQLKKILPLAREKLLYELINGLAGTEEQIRERSSYLRMFQSADQYRVIIVAKSSDEPLLCGNEENAELAYLKIRRAAEKVFCDLLETATALRGDSILFLKGTCHSLFDKELEYRLEVFHQEAENELGCKIDIGIGPAVDSLRRLADSFRLAQKAINHRLLQEGGQILYWQDYGESSIYPGVEMDGLIGSFLDSLLIGERKKSDAIFEAIIRRLIERDSVADSEVGCICLELLIGASRIMGEMGDPAGKMPGIEKELWKRILDCEGPIQMLQETRKILAQACESISERKKSRYWLIVQSVTEYIAEHYHEDLTLQDVAGKVYLSPSYLGAILRTELKQSFTEYLVRIRIEKAKELLKNPQLKLYEIAEQVGYQNPAYFCNVFKRHTGILPKEFRNLQDINETE